MRLQLREFKKEIERVFYGGQGGHLAEPQNWLDAFAMLTDSITLLAKRKKVVLFFDEFPWMATRKSGALQALDYYWNRFWVCQPQIKLIVCGSAASWMITNLLNNKKGLHNRVTQRIRLEPFNLGETQAYLRSQGILLDQRQILTLYMSIGGIPFYLRGCEKGYSAIQNINHLCFQKKGMLQAEFTNLFTSLFASGDGHESLMRFLSAHRGGISRQALEQHSGLKGGRLTVRLKELEEAGFIQSFLSQGRERGTFYKIVDEYSLFYLSWIAPEGKSVIEHGLSNTYWDVISQTAAWKAWSGYAFEAVCLKHLAQIRSALHIPEGSRATTWRFVPPPKSPERGAQIDLLFERPDQVIQLCEIKYTATPYEIDKAYAQNLSQKVQVYRLKTQTEKQIFISMITACRLKNNLYAQEMIASEVTLQDLFA